MTYARFGGQQECIMVAKKDLTDHEKQELRRMSAEGRTKSYACKALSITPERMNLSADRTGFRPELDKLFPGARSKLVMTDELFEKFVELSECFGFREACKRLTTTPYSAKLAAHEAGCLVELCAMFPQVRRTTVEVKTERLPRDIDPAVKWLTREWRKAA